MPKDICCFVAFSSMTNEQQNGVYKRGSYFYQDLDMRRLKFMQCKMQSDELKLELEKCKLKCLN